MMEDTIEQTNSIKEFSSQKNHFDKDGKIELLKENEQDRNTMSKNNDCEEKSDLESLLKMKETIESEEILKKKYQEHISNVQHNLNIFLLWMKNNNNKKNLYKDFCDTFSTEYRIQLFENINEFFKDETFVTDEILFYWKYLTIFLLKINKKYQSHLQNLSLNFEDKETNLKMVKEKYIFKCFIDEEQICFLKDNGTDYYVS